MDDKKKEVVNFTVALPNDLNEKIEQEAIREKRSKSKQVEWIVEKYYSSSKSALRITEHSKV